MGGRLVDPQTTDLAERRLLNVVEEMSLASGVPVPPVYVMDNELSINAFAAGFHPNDAVVTVSRGCLQYLTREELQGVLGHEFSHVLNGDMRLNLRLIGLVYGILVLSLIGYFVMRSAGWAGSSRDSDDRRGDNRAAIFFIGLALYVLGYLGVLLGNIIKAAISRQREFLADASSVQFTRNPGGLAGALKKIGGLAEGSRINDPHAHEVSHMFFGDAFAGSFFNLFATHPPLEERIRLLDPNFDGSYAAVEALPEEGAGAAARAGCGRLQALASGLASGPRLRRAPAADAGGQVSTDRYGSRPGRQSAAGTSGACRPIGRGPAGGGCASGSRALFRAGRDFCPALESRRPVHPQPAVATAPGPGRAAAAAVVQQLSGPLDQLPAENRLPVVDMTIPALKRLSPAQYQAFRQIVEALTAADGKVDLFEYCLRVILFSYLDVQFGLRPAPAVRYKTAAPCRTGDHHPFRAGLRGSKPAQRHSAGLPGRHPRPARPGQIVPPQQCTFDTFDAALAQLAQASPAVKRAVLEAVVACIAADGKMTVVENEILRAVAAALACPLPPVPVH